MSFGGPHRWLLRSKTFKGNTAPSASTRVTTEHARVVSCQASHNPLPAKSRLQHYYCKHIQSQNGQSKVSSVVNLEFCGIPWAHEKRPPNWAIFETSFMERFRSSQRQIVPANFVLRICGSNAHFLPTACTLMQHVRSLSKIPPDAASQSSSPITWAASIRHLL